DRRAFFGGVGVEALSFLETLALAELVGAGLAIRRAIRGHHASRAPAHHGRRFCEIGQALAGVPGARVEIVEGLTWGLQRRQDRFGFLEQLSDLVEQARIFLARRRRLRRELDLLRRR